MTSATAHRRARVTPTIAARQSGWRPQRRTTPGRLRALWIAAAVLLTVFGTVAYASLAIRRNATQAAVTVSEPMMAQAENLYGSLADADATVDATFSAGGLEPPASRARYLLDLRDASDRISALTAQPGGAGPATAAIASLSEQLPVYSGLIDTARTYNSEGLPLGAGYLREASGLMRSTLLPAAQTAYLTEADRLDAADRRATSSITLAAEIASALLAVGVLILAQIYLTRRTNRLFNVPLALATMVVLAASIWVVVGSVVQRDALARSAHTGSDGVQLLSATKILALRAQSDDSLRLLTRGSDLSYAADFSNVNGHLTGDSSGVGLITATVQWALGSGNIADVSKLTSDTNAYLSLHRKIATLEDNGAYDTARRRTDPSVAATLDEDLAGSISAMQARFLATAAGAVSATRWVGAIALVLSAAAIFLSSIGLKRRLDEYR